jgi:hypothetical protein
VSGLAAGASARRGALVLISKLSVSCADTAGRGFLLVEHDAIAGASPRKSSLGVQRQSDRCGRLPLTAPKAERAAFHNLLEDEFHDRQKAGYHVEPDQAKGTV